MIDAKVYKDRKAAIGRRYRLRKIGIRAEIIKLSCPKEHYLLFADDGK